MIDESLWDVQALVEAELERVAVVARDKGLEPMSSVDGPWHVRAPRAELSKLLSKLVEQALESAERGELIVSAELEGEDGAALLHLAVAAPGSAPASRSFAAGAEALGGRSGVESVPGRDFVLWARVPVSSPRLLESARTRCAGKRVLVIDAGAVHGELLRRRMERWDLSVDVARCGDEAMQRFGDATYDAAVVDRLALFGLTPEEQARLPSARALMTFPMPFASTTTDRFASWAKLDKPIRSAELRACLNALLGEPAQAAPAAEL